MAQNKKLLRRRKEHREIFEMINSSDVTVQVLDARFPQKCRNETIESYAKSKGKQVVCCINKADLISQDIAERWKKILSKDLPTVFISALDRQGTSYLRQQIRRYSPQKETLVCVVGYPNVGKSSIINVLRGKRSAPTSPKAGFTRHLRTVKITESLKLIDTPGIAPTDILSVEEEVFLGTVSPEDISNPDIVFTYIVDQFKKQHLEQELEKYIGTDIDQSSDEILALYAKKRGLIKKGAEPQIEEAARILIRDFMMGKIRYFEDPKNSVELTKQLEAAEQEEQGQKKTEST